MEQVSRSHPSTSWTHSRAVGVDARDVLFSNTVKPEAHIRDAALQGVWRFALDSEGELLKIAAAAPGSAIYVRLNVEDSRSLFPLSRKFGTSADEALRLLRMAPECGLRPYGLTFHVGSQCTDPSMYARAIERCGLVMRRLEQFGTRIEMLNIGGGMPATYPSPCPTSVPWATPSATLSPDCRTARHSSQPSRDASWSPRAACWWRRSSVSPSAAPICGRTSTSVVTTA